MLESGPLIRPGGVVQEEEEEEVEGTSSPPEEDLHALLVKAWEVKVFPVIQKRFRNDHERKSGLEQIKGALQLGMSAVLKSHDTHVMCLCRDGEYSSGDSGVPV